MEFQTSLESGSICGLQWGVVWIFFFFFLHLFTSSFNTSFDAKVQTDLANKSTLELRMHLEALLKVQYNLPFSQQDIKPLTSILPPTTSPYHAQVVTIKGS